MTDKRKTLTEETPENNADFTTRGLTEVGGQVQATKSLTETLPIEEDEDGDRQTLLG